MERRSCFFVSTMVPIVVFLFSCEAEVDSPETSEEDTCIDLDEDGFGENCPNGEDCDDNDPTVGSCDQIPDGDEDTEIPDRNEDNGIGVFLFGQPQDSVERTSWNPTEENSRNVLINPDGELQLQENFTIEPTVWVANYGEGTVSRLDAETGQETGRYPSIITGAASENDPSRTAIDFHGHCWVANRLRGTRRVGIVTKIASRIDDCVDRNRDGVIQTSRDINGDGVISLDTDEYLDSEDECVLFSVAVGDSGSIPRALAIAPNLHGGSSSGNAWVGLNYGEGDSLKRSCAELDGATGEVIRYIPLPLNPYGAIASKYQRQVWFVSADWQASQLVDNPPAIVSVNFETGEVSPRYEVEGDDGCVGSYGLTIDDQSRIWIAGYRCNRAFRFDPNIEEWFYVELGSPGRGLVADRDGWIWVAHSNGCGEERCGVISRFHGDDGSDLLHYYLPNGNHTIGADIDINGKIWVVNKDSDSTSRIDPITGVIDEFPTGRQPYTYSDFTGHSLILQFPRGYYRTTIHSCLNATWEEVFFDATLPEDTAAEIRVRTANEESNLSEALWVGPWTVSPGNLQAPPGPVPNGAYLELEITLATANREGETPRVRSVDLSYSCPVD